MRYANRRYEAPSCYIDVEGNRLFKKLNYQNYSCECGHNVFAHKHNMRRCVEIGCECNGFILGEVYIRLSKEEVGKVMIE